MCVEFKLSDFQDASRTFAARLPILEDGDRAEQKFRVLRVSASKGTPNAGAAGFKLNRVRVHRSVSAMLQN